MNENGAEIKTPKRGLADAVVWIVVLIILTPLVVLAVLALLQRFS